MIYGTGIDIVEVQRMSEIMARRGSSFISRVFTGSEIDYCRRRALPAMHFAVRFAAKESLLKALGIGLGMGVGLKEIEVSADGRGKPELRLYGRASALLSDLGIGAVHVSLSHTRNYAAAVMVLEKI